MTPEENKADFKKALMALRLEVHGSIFDDLERRWQIDRSEAQREAVEKMVKEVWKYLATLSYEEDEDGDMLIEARINREKFFKVFTPEKVLGEG